MSTIPSALPKRSPNLKLALLFGIAGVLATLALWPYLLVLMPQQLAALPLPLPAVIAAQTARAGMLCWLLAWLGLYLGCTVVACMDLPAPARSFTACTLVAGNRARRIGRAGGHRAVVAWPEGAR